MFLGQGNKGTSNDEVQRALDKLLDQYPAAHMAPYAVALTLRPRPAHVATTTTTTTSPTSTDRPYKLVKVPVPLLDTTTTLFPIGAGDAVAAGTLAAWHVLEQQDDAKQQQPSWVPVLQARHKDNNNDWTLVTAFSFGLACGSASCLQQENSFLEIADVCKLLATTAITKQ